MPTRAVWHLMVSLGQMARRTAGRPATKIFVIILTAGFGCITAGTTADTYIRWNANGWAVMTNSAPRTKTGWTAPKVVYDDSPPPPGYAEQAARRQAARELQELYRKRVAIPDAVSDDVRRAYLASAAIGKKVAIETASSAFGANLLQFFLYAALFFLIGLLAARRFAPGILAYLQNKLNPWSPDPAKAAVFSAKVRSEEAAFANFASTFRVGPAGPATANENGHGAMKGEQDVVRKFIGRTAGLLLAQRKIFEDIDRAWTEPARYKLMPDLREKVTALKDEANFPEVLLIWQVASALEGLLKQLTERAGNITPSTLRTIRGGVDLLTDLCAPGLKPDLLTERPLRFLAADDDLISRQALSVALKKALNQPDLVVDGQGAIVLANKNSYDVIFLDVQMPGMDGFELCSKIHETEINRVTPVVFVTGQNDFDTRAQSTLSGGTDLMAKPFLTFEVTVKALTLALRGRIQEHLNTSAFAEPDRPVAKAPVSRPEPGVETLPAPVRAKADLKKPVEVAPAAPDNKPVVTFLALLTKHLPALKEDGRKILEASEARQDRIADAFLRVHSIVPDITLGLRHPAYQMSVALEGLLRKLLADQENTSASAIATIIAAIDLLQELAGPGITPDLSTQQSVEILVVDDDIVSRRALVGALQLTFEKPEAVDSGEAALALAGEKAFDVIFMDVMMPGMDGFAACEKIHETTLNRSTPVIFVTGQANREQMTKSGGSDMMGKPFLNADITVKALAYALRGRLQKHKLSTSVKPS